MVTSAWKLSPSDFAFLWEECKRCFYLKVARGFDRPRSIMPKIFTVIDREMTQQLSGRRTQSITSGIPEGTIDLGQRWVRSDVVPLPSGSSCFISGRFDTVIRLDDGTFGIIDFKTSDAKDEHLPLYGRQLHAYAFALAGC